MSDWVWPNTRVVRCLDGDTCDISVTRDIGFEGVVTFPIRVRLNRINAPALSSPAGKAARDRVVALLGTTPVNVTTLRGYKYGAPTDQTGSWMAEVVLPDGANLSDTLVTEGHAVYWDGTGPRPHDNG
jgi:endonuclease YncB( thermonuclease family)